MKTDQCILTVEDAEERPDPRAEIQPKRILSKLYLDLWEQQLREAAVKDDLTGGDLRWIRTG